MRKTVYVTKRLPEEILAKLSSQFEVRMWDEEETPVPWEVLLKEVADVDGLYCFITDTIDKEVFEQAKKLKMVSTCSVGYNHIDVQAAAEKGVKVGYTPGVLTETTADLTFALLMATARRVVEASDILHNGKWGSWSLMQMTGQDIFGATIGIIGLGRIGEALVKRAKGFDMKVLYNSRSRKPEKEAELGIEYADLKSLLQQADFVCLMLPYSVDVHRLIGKEELALMKKNAILINTARGGIVDEDALYQAVKDGVIWGAGLDVFEQEPVSLDHPLLTLPNVVALPHIGSASVQTRLGMAHMAADNLIHVLNGNVEKANVVGN